MGSERRGHDRIARPLEADWQGSSGAHRGRLTDISPGGCFFETPVPASAGERTTITVWFTDTDSMSLGGEVVYQEPRLGFALRFVDLPDDRRLELERWLDQLKSKAP